MTAQMKARCSFTQLDYSVENMKTSFIAIYEVKTLISVFRVRRYRVYPQHHYRLILVYESI